MSGQAVPAGESPFICQIAGLTIRVTADLPVSGQTFGPAIRAFQVETSEAEATLHHHFYLPSPVSLPLETLVYRQPPWRIYQSNRAWIYLGFSSQEDSQFYQVALFNLDHTHGEIYTLDSASFLHGGLHSLTLFPTDQIWLAILLANRQACILHAAGLIFQGGGYAFVGHSEAGKSTIARRLMPYGELLCDDRVILRYWPEGFRVYGTWSHGENPQVSPASAPLRALFLLEKASENALVPLERAQVVRQLPQFLIRPLITANWWEKTLDLLGIVAGRVPVYRLRFTRQGDVIELLQSLAL